MNARFYTMACLLILIGSALELRAGDKEQPDFMDVMQKYGSAGPEHKNLEPLVGKWKVAVKFYGEPGKEPTESEGTASREWILGKRYLAEHFNGDFFGQKFEGMGISGYDRFKKKYVGGWVDSMSTSILTNEGKYNPKTKTFTYTSVVKDPYTGGGKMKTTDTMQIISPDEHVMIMFREPLKGGKKTKMMELRYTRTK